MTKQDRYELFLDDQQQKAQKVWFAHVPEIMDSLVDVIERIRNCLPNEKLEKFNSRTVPELRNLYRELRFYTYDQNSYQNYLDSQEAVRNMCSKINGWFRSSHIAVGVKVTADPKYYGKDSIPEKFELLISDSFDVTTNRI